LQIQRQLSKSDGISLTYAGNYGYNEIIQNPYVNAASGEFNNATGAWQLTPAGSFGGLPVAPPDPSFSTVNSFTNNARSNYNGLSGSYTHQGNGVIGHLSYTYSHDLDDTSNGGVAGNEPYNAGSLAKQLTPTLTGPGNLNYSNADYDIRNDLVGDVLYEEPFKVHNAFINPLVSGWTIAGKEYYRSGEPFSVLNSNVIAGLPVLAGLGSTLLAQATTSGLTNSCGSNPHAAVNAQCLDATQYVGATQNTFGNVRRNAFYGPHYADTDATLTKQVVKKEGVNFVVGAQVYNIFNHPNFGNPGSTLGTGNFGLISNTQAPPTSPYGSFQGAAVTQRVLVVTGKITF
jgi:hypothetical protein